jgi:hypothetical protein
MRRVMTFSLNTKHLSVLIKPKDEWSGKINEENVFEISCMSDSE